jgi:SAM-dependent methyltransferase
MRGVEDTYWWYRVLRGLVTNEVARWAGQKAGLRILDAGCGTGGMMDCLRRSIPGVGLTGFDISPLALRHTRARGFNSVFEAGVSDIPLPAGSQDAVISLDVLYHAGVEQEEAMREFRRVLSERGLLLMNLPAYECLRGKHDIAVQNVRRYTPRDVRQLHERHGFAVEKLFCWNAWLFLPLLLWRRLSHWTSSSSPDEVKSDLASPPRSLNRILTAVGCSEAALCQTLRSPVGTSVFSVGRKMQT